MMPEERLSHLDEQGRAHMVDVGAKNDTERVAIAAGEIVMRSETLQLIQTGLIKKGMSSPLLRLPESKRQNELLT